MKHIACERGVGGLNAEDVRTHSRCDGGYAVEVRVTVGIGEVGEAGAHARREIA